MAKQHTTPEENPTEKLSEAYDRLELFYEEHKQKVLAGLGIVVALVA